MNVYLNCILYKTISIRKEYTYYQYELNFKFWDRYLYGSGPRTIMDRLPKLGGDLFADKSKSPTW